MEKLFKLKERKTKVSIEIMAGITTFLAMSYILIVNPNTILSGPSDARFSSVFIATAIGSFIASLLMALIANSPLVEAPGMGFNAMIGGIIAGSAGFAFSYGNAMLLVFISGLLFLLISVLPSTKKENGRVLSLRELLLDGIPVCLRKAIPIGIGLFITFIGLQCSSLIVDNKFTLLQLVDFNNYDLWHNGGAALQAIVMLFGLIIISILSHYKVKGSIVIGILSSTILSLFLGVADINVILGKTEGISWNFIDNIKNYFTGDIFLSALKDTKLPAGSLLTSIVLVITFVMVDLFDTMGTVMGCAKEANLLDENDKPKDFDKIMYADSMGTCVGALAGASSVTTFVESSIGIAEGGKTGLTTLTAAIMFLLSIFLLPIFAFIPRCAAAGALIYVGVLMIKNIVDVDFTNIKYALPSFLTMIIMPLSYSITDGIGIGLVTYVILNTIIYLIDLIRNKKDKTIKPNLEVSKVCFVTFILFLVYFLVPTIV